MRIEINERLVRRNRSVAQYAFIISMAIWLFGLFVTMRPLLGDRFASDDLAWSDYCAVCRSYDKFVGTRTTPGKRD